MLCEKCGKELDMNGKFCQNCGNKFNNDNIVENSNKVQPIKVASQSVQQGNTYQTNGGELNNSNTKKTNHNIKGIISLVFGIISVGMFLLIWFSLPLGIAGLILGLKSKVKNGLSKAGIVLSIIGMTLTLTIYFLIFASLAGAKGEKTYIGDGYQLKYNNKWSVETIYEGQEALKYEDGSSYLLSISKSTLPNANIDFSTIIGKQQLYDELYDYYENDTYKIYNGSGGFKILKDDIYYASYNYGTSSNEIKGKYYIILSVDKNIIVSFVSKYEGNITNDDERSLDLLKTIVLSYNSKDDTGNKDINIDENEIYNVLLKSAWNKYPNLRKGTLAKSSTINGGWRILSGYETYWEFKNGEFWWYKSFNDLDDNYWYGTTTILTGKEGLKAVGIDENKLDAIITSSSGKITANDVYTIVCTPKKIISGGVDKSSTNIKEGTSWKQIWIIVNHGQDGIEGQLLDTNAGETSYYVKIKD